jgi:hypothetical protein
MTKAQGEKTETPGTHLEDVWDVIENWHLFSNPSMF